MRVILSLLFEKLFVKILTLRQTYYMLRMFAVRFFVKCGYFKGSSCLTIPGAKEKYSIHGIIGRLTGRIDHERN